MKYKTLKLRLFGLKLKTFGCYESRNNGTWLFLEDGFKVFIPKRLVMQMSSYLQIATNYYKVRVNTKKASSK